MFNFTVATDAQHADEADGTGHASKKLKTKEDGESSTSGTNCNTDGIIYYI